MIRRFRHLAPDEFVTAADYNRLVAAVEMLLTEQQQAQVQQEQARREKAQQAMLDHYHGAPPAGVPANETPMR